MTYEYGSFFGTSSYSFPVYYRISADPEAFDSAPHHRLIPESGNTPTSSPYVTWTPYGGEHGTIIVSSGSSSSIFVNQALGQGEWRVLATPEETSYTRSLRVLGGKQDRMLAINGAGVLNGKDNSVTISVIDLHQALK